VPTPTYVSLGTITLGSNQATVTFSSIPATYRDLILVGEGTQATLASPAFICNGVVGGYAVVNMYGFTSVASQANTFNYGPLGWFPVAGIGRFTFIANFMDYSATDKHKTVLTRGNDDAAYVDATATRFPSTAAVNSITLTGFNNGGVWAAGSTFSLFGVN
jgi:hypothetical protein